jgi:hypothetical protein
MQSAVAALRPLADAVFNDNGDMTVILPVVSSEECISAYFARKRLRVALSALVEDQPVAVKALEWTKSSRVGSYVAHGAGIMYAADQDHDGVVLAKWEGSSTLKSVHETIEKAQAFAQADYEQRIRSALVDVPAVESEPLGYISAYGLEKLQTRNHYCVSVSHQSEKEFVIPIYGVATLGRSAIAPAPAGEDVVGGLALELLEALCKELRLNRGEHQDLINRARAALSRKGSDAQTVERCRGCDGYNCDDGCAYPGSDAQTVGGGMATEGVPEAHVDVEAEIASVVQSVNEWDDRTSPDDYPYHLLITSEELSDILRNFAATLKATRSMSFSSDDDALEFLKLYGHEESRNGVIRGDWRCFDTDCRAAVGYLCDEWDFVFEDTATPSPQLSATTHRDPLPSDADDMGDGAGGVAKGGDR